jgi:hypothetical protein
MMAATNLLGSQRHHSFGHPKSYYPFRIWTLGHPVLRPGIIIVFVAVALLLFDWESPSPDSTLVLDAFDALAEILTAKNKNSGRAARARGSRRRLVAIARDNLIDRA